MANTIEVKVPDIGDYSNVPVIEILVAVGDTVAKDQGLVTLESDKATLEVPSTAAGVVREIKVKLDDKLSEGDVVVVLEAEHESRILASIDHIQQLPGVLNAALIYHEELLEGDV